MVDDDRTAGVALAVILCLVIVGAYVGMRLTENGRRSECIEAVYDDIVYDGEKIVR